MNKDRAATEKAVRGLQNDGFSAIMLTVDAAMPGKRELDQRTKGEWEGPAVNGKVDGESKGVAHVRSSFFETAITKAHTFEPTRRLADIKTRMCAVCHMTFFPGDRRTGVVVRTGDDITWIRSLTKLPLVIKGIQCVEVRAGHR